MADNFRVITAPCPHCGTMITMIDASEQLTEDIEYLKRAVTELNMNSFQAVKIAQGQPLRVHQYRQSAPSAALAALPPLASPRSEG
jgi:hypothetical protein